jgi:hypothetical protein
MFSLIALALIDGRALGDGAVQPDDDISQRKIDAAETRMLQKTVKEQQSDIASLNAEVAALKAQLQSMGLTPVTDATTQPASLRKAKRIIFIYAENSPGVDAEIHKAVDGLDSDQWFNVYTLYIDHANPYTPKFIQATADNKKRFASELHPRGFNAANLFSGVAIATQVDPDVIWVVGSPYSRPDEDSFIADLHKIAPGFRGRIDTAAAFVLGNASDLHFLWRLSHETGGVCVDSDGKPIDEPPVPLVAPAVPPQPQPQTPGMLRDK